MKHIAVCMVFYAMLFLPSAQSAQTITLKDAAISIERIWDRSAHSAFTDLVRFNGKLYCGFREGNSHVPGKSGYDGTARIIASEDGMNWKSVALLSKKGVDLRDPKLSVTPKGRLMVVMGGSYYTNKGKRLKMVPQVAFSDQSGTNFSDPIPAVFPPKIDYLNQWLWRVTWHEGIAYGVIYQGRKPDNTQHLLSSRDGIHYDYISTLDVVTAPGETTLRFMPDGKMVALVRCGGVDKNGSVGISEPPYKKWTFNKLNIQLGGPNFIRLPNGRLLMGTRSGHENNKKYKTSLYWLNTNGATELIFTLPSSGDTSYPGFVLDDDRVLMSYYSSHESKTSIYLVTLRLDVLMGK
jgi:hypothetical protein